MHRRCTLKTPFALCGLSLLLLASYSSNALGVGYYAVTRVAGIDSLNLRATPVISGRIVGYIPFNAVRVQNLGERLNGWCKVKYANSSGWAACSHLTESDGNRYYASQGYNDRLNIRKTPSTTAAIVGTIPPLETGIQGTGECSSTWCPIDYQGKRGWVGRRYLSSWSF